jgi:hypothetical protein
VSARCRSCSGVGRGNDGESCWGSKSSGAELHHAAKAKTTLLLQAKAM